MGQTIADLSHFAKSELTKPGLGESRAGRHHPGMTTLPSLTDWIGRREIQTDRLAPAPAARLMAALHSQLALPAAGDAAPLLGHWICFGPIVAADETGDDGHPRRGGFLPPVALPRRMWAGSRILFHRPLGIGRPIERRSTIADVIEKNGRSGRLVFVRVDHEIHDDAGLLLIDSHDIVYREAPDPGTAPTAPVAAPATSDWRRRIDPDPVLLFRYSALTFNGHRIHYDRDYATGAEGYPGLVVHGPLIATLLLHELVAQQPDARIAGFAFRAVKPIFDIAPFDVCGSIEGKTAHLFARDADGALCMTATADLL